MKNKLLFQKLIGTITIGVFLSSTFFVGASIAGARFINPEKKLNFEGIVDCGSGECYHNGQPYLTILTSSSEAFYDVDTEMDINNLEPTPVTVRIPFNFKYATGDEPETGDFVKVIAKRVDENFFDFVASQVRVQKQMGGGAYGTNGDPVKIKTGTIQELVCGQYMVVKITDFYYVRFQLNASTNFPGKTCGDFGIGDTVQVKGTDFSSGFIADSVQMTKKAKQDKYEENDYDNNDWELDYENEDEDEDEGKGRWKQDKSDYWESDEDEDEDKGKGRWNRSNKDDWSYEEDEDEDEDKGNGRWSRGSNNSWRR